MSTSKIYTYQQLRRLAIRLRDDLNSKDFVLMYAYNGTGKTRLSIEFKTLGEQKAQQKKQGERDTLYFNAYTEDQFTWNNDLGGNNQPVLKINADSHFFDGFKALALEEKIFTYLQRYATFDFKIDYEQWSIRFFNDRKEYIKISRGEENIFIWCLFLALCELTVDNAESYEWVKYLYIDDPVSSLDDNNAIAIASDLAKLLKRGKGQVKTVVSSHHSLFFNVICNELKKADHKRYFLHRLNSEGKYTLRATDDTPFFHHVSLLTELQQAAKNNKIYTYHFNQLRSVLEKTATFFGFSDFSSCLHGVDDEVLYARALNLLSHGKYSVYEPIEMVEDSKNLFKQILNAFLQRYRFALPELFPEQPATPSQS